jgi:hypothetical protein
LPVLESSLPATLDASNPLLGGAVVQGSSIYVDTDDTPSLVVYKVTSDSVFVLTLTRQRTLWRKRSRARPACFRKVGNRCRKVISISGRLSGRKCRCCVESVPRRQWSHHKWSLFSRGPYLAHGIIPVDDFLFKIWQEVFNVLCVNG